MRAGWASRRSGWQSTGLSPSARDTPRPLHRGGERPQRRPAGAEEGAAPSQGHRATLVIAKLDRLSRNAAFLLTLRDSGVKFAAVDLPEANDLTVGIMALVAQAEREAISRRTKEALSGSTEPRGAARQPERRSRAQASR